MILFIAGIFLVVIDKDTPEDFSQEIHEKEQGILREIQLNNSLRENILSFSIGSLPIEWESLPEGLIPSYLECKSKICKTDEDCILSEPVNKSIYTQEVIISSTLETYNPRKLKIFCWEK